MHGRAVVAIALLTLAPIHPGSRAGQSGVDDAGAVHEAGAVREEGAGEARVVGREPGAVDYVPPVSPLRVVRPFAPPPDPYAAGHRGVDLRAGPGTTVVAAGAGVVRFAGSVAGRGVIVVAHPDGVSTEYEPVTPSVRVGETVRARQPIGQVRGTHPGCPDSCLHWGARRGADYLDPLTLLGALGPVVLLPWPRGG